MARLEWALFGIYEAQTPQRCLCGKYPIIEICTLKNKLNNSLATVGNCCVKKFIGLPSDKIFQAVKRVRKDLSKTLNPETIAHALEKRWINDWESTFYLNIIPNRSLSAKQAEKKTAINQKITCRIQTGQATPCVEDFARSRVKAE